jgi:F-type H+-transporting ATPase subunit a
MMLALLQEPQKVDVGEMVLHHTADAWTWEPVYGVTIHLPRWPDVHLGPVTLNLSPTKHVLFLFIVAALTFVVMWWTGRSLARQGAHARAPHGFAGAMEGLVLWVRDDMAIGNIGHEAGAKFAPLIVTLFFFILFANLMGLMPFGTTVTGNLAVTGALAIMVFLIVEVAGFLKLGPRGYLATIFPHFPGMHGPAALAFAIFMAPIEILGKLVKPFALAVRLFGNMTAGHFVILSLFGIVFLFGTLGVWSYGIGIAAAVTVLGVMLLELIVAMLQAYVFALLSAVFIGLMQHEH